MWNKISKIIHNNIEISILIEFYLCLNNLYIGEPFVAAIWLCLMILDFLCLNKNIDKKENNDNDEE